MKCTAGNVEKQKCNDITSLRGPLQPTRQSECISLLFTTAELTGTVKTVGSSGNSIAAISLQLLNSNTGRVQLLEKAGLMTST